MSTIQLNNGNFEKEVIKSEMPVLVDFWAAWCGPCQMLAPTIDELAAELTEVKVCKVNVDENPELASRYKIMTIPSLLVFRNGEVVNRSIGVKSKKEIKEFIEEK